MAAEVASNPVLMRRFENELTAATRLHHPNIIQAYEFGLHQGRPYLAMAFVNGESLGQRIRRGGAFPEAEAVRVIIQIADALHCAHQNKLIHRDVKSDNILLKDDGQAMLADLGLIKDVDHGEGLTRTCLPARAPSSRLSSTRTASGPMFAPTSTAWARPSITPSRAPCRSTGDVTCKCCAKSSGMISRRRVA